MAKNSKPSQQINQEEYEFYTQKEIEYIDKYKKLTGKEMEDEEIYDIVIKYNYDDAKIRDEILEKIEIIRNRGDDYSWNLIEKGKKTKVQAEKKEEKIYKGKKDFGQNNKGKNKENNYEYGYNNNYRKGYNSNNYRGGDRKKNYHKNNYQAKTETEVKVEISKPLEVVETVPKNEEKIVEVKIEETPKIEEKHQSPKKEIEKEVPQQVVEDKVLEVEPQAPVPVEIEVQDTEVIKKEQTLSTEELVSHYMRKIDIVNTHTINIKGEEKPAAPQVTHNPVINDNNVNKNIKQTPYSPLTPPDISAQYPPYMMVFDPNIQQYVSIPFNYPGYLTPGFMPQPEIFDDKKGKFKGFGSVNENLPPSFIPQQHMYQSPYFYGQQQPFMNETMNNYYKNLSSQPPSNYQFYSNQNK